jgi:glycosyltransferase involved in cell wall biosynthesis
MRFDKFFNLAIDASRNRSGGAIAHLIGMLSNCVPERFGISEVHVWAYGSLLDQLPNRAWLIKHHSAALEASLGQQLFWQATKLADEVTLSHCDILFSTDASSLCDFEPMVVLSQDMLSYEPGVMEYFGYGLARLRLLAILLIQNRTFRRSAGVIFLTRYAGDIIQRSCGALKNVAYVPHGVDKGFKEATFRTDWPASPDLAVRCVYVSNTEMYKHQWTVVHAVANLRERGYNVTLSLIGGGRGRAQRQLDRTVVALDPDGCFVEQHDFLAHATLPDLLTRADIFVFASSCENMPVTLVEAMAVGLPIACSNRGPMPEILRNGGVYFDPEDANSISSAIEKLIKSPTLRLFSSRRAKELAKQYCWRRCADETLGFIRKTYLGNL